MTTPRPNTPGTSRCAIVVAGTLLGVFGGAAAWAAEPETTAVQRAEARAQACYDELDLPCTRAALEAALDALGPESPPKPDDEPDAAEGPADQSARATASGQAERTATRVRLLTWLGVTLSSMDSLDTGAGTAPAAGPVAAAEDRFFQASLLTGGAALDLSPFGASPKIEAVAKRGQARAVAEIARRQAEQATLEKARSEAVASIKPSTLRIFSAEPLGSHFMFAVASGLPFLADNNAGRFSMGPAASIRFGYQPIRQFWLVTGLYGMIRSVDTAVAGPNGETPRAGDLRYYSVAAGFSLTWPLLPLDGRDRLEIRTGLEVGYAAFEVEGSAVWGTGRGPCIRVPVGLGWLPAALRWERAELGFGVSTETQVVFAGRRFAAVVPVLLNVEIGF